jgi:hypothetical protein
MAIISSLVFVSSLVIFMFAYFSVVLMFASSVILTRAAPFGRFRLQPDVASSLALTVGATPHKLTHRAATFRQLQLAKCSVV